ncbi:hypothetical protein PoB_005507700 [Plakobranchus ocellatus]|uniref:DDE Tnp4 domain-containing protein n=1 Tax=Plakobranchus ocellatus TaxID=259542 RepID=A0AAV4CAI4_9GAST|nr:hypothetical protein PoB_005507700 [Plakobranchus ocellatus]
MQKGGSTTTVYRHSRARRAVECAFGILASKFEIFQRPLRVERDKAIIITKATVGLHNFIRHRDGNMIDRTSSIVYEIRDNTGRDGLLPLALTGCRAAEDAMKVRDALSEFFSDPSGSVYWQNDLVYRNVSH